MAEFSEMTVGYDFTAAQEYLENLNAKMITDTIEIVNSGPAYKALIKELQEGWVGQSQINFVTRLNNAGADLSEALKVMRDSIESMLAEIEEEMIARDNDIVEEEVASGVASN